MQLNLTQITIIYYHDESLELLHEVKSFPKNQQGRVVIPELFKKGKSIIAVCEGEIKILNKVGDRILSVGKLA
ncbi:TIGR02922 family protein [Colwellia piezophila]|uniref:TIGR02922 family protein n=1 Tax=Colwellia piezophila TaxID=211668 RepID=UPI000380A3F2|nr:TIGR02922 family protein [Colwellia piezophila]